MFEYKKFDILEVAEQCGIQLNPRTLDKNEVEAWCPFCQTKSSDYHLYLNQAKEMFYCQKCSASGNSVSLYARIYGISNKEAAEHLTSGVFPGIQSNPENILGKMQSACAKHYELAPLHRRHDIYYDMLDAMELLAEHRGDLTRRGLSMERIRQNMYRSIPKDFCGRREIARHLAKRHDLRGVPGFYYSKSGCWEIAGKPGILIPVCDRDGYIQGLQIRLDNTNKKKYRWLSSNPNVGYPYGTASSVWVHVTGNRNSEECELTEGALKGDVASYLTSDRLFVCTAGASSIQYLISTLQALNIKKVNGCYDMDKVAEYYNLVERRRKDPLDKEAAKPCPLEKMEAAVTSAGFTYERRIWTPSLNGIDEYYLDWVVRQQRAA